MKRRGRTIALSRGIAVLAIAVLAVGKILFC
jgi:hypothetical protein